MHTLNIGHLSTVYHTSFILMGTDWLKKAGIHANWRLFASGPDIVKAFRNKELDLGYIGLPPAIIGIDKCIPIICVAGGHVEGTVLIARRGYRTWKDMGDIRSVLSQFDGKTIGSPPAGSIHDVIIKDAIEKAGLDINVKNFPWTDFVLEAMVDKEVDAAVGTPSLAVAAARGCDAIIVIPPHVLWPYNPSYGIVLRKELIRDPDIITDFLKIHEKASNFIRKKTDEAAKIVSNVSGIVDEDFVIQAYSISPKYCAALSSGFVDSTMAFVPVLHRLKYISRTLSENEIFDYSLINDIHKENPHYETTH
ncbi:MAG: ABC transporter substrate-binding protein [Candidatus Methanoperedens sp.]|nr:ABC transporter substrate-binding protein [Candidatus Methanoperedens sp.]